jgi:hypothetical protein
MGVVKIMKSIVFFMVGLVNVSHSTGFEILETMPNVISETDRGYPDPETEEQIKSESSSLETQIEAVD